VDLGFQLTGMVGLPLWALKLARGSKEGDDKGRHHGGSSGPRQLTNGEGRIGDRAIRRGPRGNYDVFGTFGEARVGSSCVAAALEIVKCGVSQIR
jgi:hypothetical protein